MDRPRGKYERLGIERQARDVALAFQPGGHPRGLRWDPSAGDRVWQWIEQLCRHHKGEWAGKPLHLEDWQRDLIREAFGWFLPDGTRRFRTVYWEIPRKNGKSTKVAGIGLYLLVGDQEPGAEVYSAATKKDQAKIVWNDAAAMVKKSAELRRFVRAYRNNLHCERLGSKFEPLGADSETADGLNPHGNLVDELHAHKDRALWDVLGSAMGARRQPMTLAITTAGTYDPQAIGWEIHDYATKVLEGTVEDDSFHAFIASASEGEADEKLLKEQPEYFYSEEALRKANPNYGISVKPRYLAQQAEHARQMPGALNEYLRKHLNIWPQQVNRWLSLDAWAECDPLPAGADARAIAVAREKALEGRDCFGGLDLSSKLDLTALVLAFSGPNDLLELVCRFWMPQAKIEEYARKPLLRHFQTWAREGWITPTPGNVVDYEFIKAEVLALGKRYQLRELGYDPWGALQIALQLQDAGVTMVETHQGYKTLSEPSKDFQARIVARKVRHANNPVQRYCVGNAVISTDPAGNIKPDKAKATGKIDGVVATVMALSRFIGAAPPQTGSYLDRQDMVVLG